uniref:Methyltransferase domain-containing protein n=1 Tax=Lotharella oceanica TaxID=641309 RepID=A0A7S2XH10_9EUKA
MRSNAARAALMGLWLLCCAAYVLSPRRAAAQSHNLKIDLGGKLGTLPVTAEAEAEVEAAAAAAAEISDEDAMAAFRRFNKRFGLVVNPGEYAKTDTTKACKPENQIRTKVWEGNHDYPLCRLPKKRHGDCMFWSFGVSNADDFSRSLAEDFKCRGFALDPSSKSENISHYMHTEPNVLYLPFGLAAPTNGPFSEEISKMEWQMTSLPSLRKFLMAAPPVKAGAPSWDGHLDVVKIDCEGCEYTIADTVLKEDRHFFKNIDQVVLELHMPKAFAPTRDVAMGIPKLIYLLEEAGLMVQPQPTGKWGACSAHFERKGCADLFVELGYERCVKKQMRICNHFIFYRDDYDAANY